MLRVPGGVIEDGRQRVAGYDDDGQRWRRQRGWQSGRCVRADRRAGPGGDAVEERQAASAAGECGELDGGNSVDMLKTTNLCLRFAEMPERDQIATRARAIAAGRSGGGRQGDPAAARDAEGVHAGRRAAAFHVADVNEHKIPKKNKEPFPHGHLQKQSARNSKERERHMNNLHRRPQHVSQHKYCTYSTFYITLQEHITACSVVWTTTADTTYIYHHIIPIKVYTRSEILFDYAVNYFHSDYSLTKTPTPTPTKPNTENIRTTFLRQFYLHHKCNTHISTLVYLEHNVHTNTKINELTKPNDEQLQPLFRSRPNSVYATNINMYGL